MDTNSFAIIKNEDYLLLESKFFGQFKMIGSDEKNTYLKKVLVN